MNIVTAINALKTLDTNTLHYCVQNKILTRPILFKEFVYILYSNVPISDETLALYATGPLSISKYQVNPANNFLDVFLNEDTDEYSFEYSDRMYGAVHLQIKAALGFYYRFMADPVLFGRIYLMEPFKASFTASKGNKPTFFAWLLAYVAGFGNTITTLTFEQQIIKTITENNGNIPLNIFNEIEQSKTVIIPNVLYYLFYFRDLLPNAVKSMKEILNIKSVREKHNLLEQGFYNDLLSVYPDIDAELLNPIDAAVVNPKRIFDVNKKIIINSDQISKIVFRCIELREYQSLWYWLGKYENLDGNTKQLLFNNSGSSYTFLQQAYQSLWATNSNLELCKSIFHLAPVSDLKLMLYNNIDSTLMAHAIYKRGFLLDDSSVYLFEKKPIFKLSGDQLRDFIFRFRGSLENAYKIVFEEMDYLVESSNTFWLGMYYGDKALLKTGALNVRSELSRTDKQQRQGKSINVDDIVLFRFNDVVPVIQTYIPKNVLAQQYLLGYIRKFTNTVNASYDNRIKGAYDKGKKYSQGERGKGRRLIAEDENEDENEPYDKHRRRDDIIYGRGFRGGRGGFRGGRGGFRGGRGGGGFRGWRGRRGGGGFRGRRI